MDFLRRFWAVAVSLAAVVGLYVAAVAIDLTEVFWIVVAASIVIGGLPIAFRKSIEIANRYRNYSKLLTQVAEHKVRNEELERDLKAAKKSAGKQWQEGLTEGRARVLGVILGYQTQPPVLVGICELSTGVALLGKPKDVRSIRRGARFSLVGANLGELRGIVEVEEVDVKTGLVILKRVDRTASAFWGHLESRVAYDTSAPTDVELVSYSIEPEQGLLPSMSARDDVVVDVEDGVSDG
ncbi:MAG TPA: hypothetical protein VFW65_18110 [Pseudonocardiaceae bacterium]|nr:hypothetical protein [Pseudonocardiaceae bacterium]